jgi:hypothetical protein
MRLQPALPQDLFHVRVHIQGGVAVMHILGAVAPSAALMGILTVGVTDGVILAECVKMCKMLGFWS